MRLVLIIKIKVLDGIAQNSQNISQTSQGSQHHGSSPPRPTRPQPGSRRRCDPAPGGCRGSLEYLRALGTYAAPPSARATDLHLARGGALCDRGRHLDRAAAVRIVDPWRRVPRGTGCRRGGRVLLVDRSRRRQRPAPTMLHPVGVATAARVDRQGGQFPAAL